MHNGQCWTRERDWSDHMGICNDTLSPFLHYALLTQGCSRDTLSFAICIRLCAWCQKVPYWLFCAVWMSPPGQSIICAQLHIITCYWLVTVSKNPSRSNTGRSYLDLKSQGSWVAALLPWSLVIVNGLKRVRGTLILCFHLGCLGSQRSSLLETKGKTTHHILSLKACGRRLPWPLSPLHLCLLCISELRKWPLKKEKRLMLSAEAAVKCKCSF